MKNQNIFKKIPQWFKKIRNNIRAVGILQWFKKILKEIRRVGIWNWIGMASLIVGIIGIYLTITISQTTDATIKIVNWRGEAPTDFVKEQIYQSKITITILGNKYMPTIDGEIKVPYSKYRNKEVEVGFSSENDALSCDKKITLTDTTKLRIYIKGLDKISGNIKDFDTEENIEGVLIKVGKKEIHSDSLGNFEINFLLNEQKVYQFIEIIKRDYKEKRFEINMSTNRYRPIPVRLHRKNTTK
jgi:hypothetical protein